MTNKKLTAVVAMLTLVNLASFLFRPIPAVAQVSGPGVQVIGVAAVGGCTTLPVDFTNAMAGSGVICVAPDAVYVSLKNVPAWTKLGSGSGTVSFSQVTGTLAPTQMPPTQTCALSGTLTSTGNTAVISSCH